MRKAFALEKHIEELHKDGVTYIPNAYSSASCKKYVAQAKKLAKTYARKGIVNLDNDSYNLSNYFRHEPSMLPLVIHPHADEILKTLLNPTYVVINSNLINRFRKTQLTSQQEVKHAGHWHSDSRYLNGKRISNGFTIIGIIMLEPFGEDNGATHYIPGSHDDVHNNYPDRYGDYKYKLITGDAGTLVLFDSALWHRGGIASDKRSRWSVYTIYGPSFVKPYFSFPDMLGKTYQKKYLDPMLRRLFHFDSMPQLNESKS